MKHIKFTLLLVCVAVLFSSQCFAARVSVGTSGTFDKVESITITIDPYSVSPEEAEKELAERQAIDKIYNTKIYFSHEEYVRDQQEKAKKILETYDVEELQKDGKYFWKCTPKNGKDLTPEELEKQIVWYKVKK